MTNEELKEKLLATKPDDQWAAGWGATVPVNPDGKAAWDRIEELEALVEKAFREGDNESGGPLGLDPWEGSYAKEVLDKIKGTNDDG